MNQFGTPSLRLFTLVFTANGAIYGLGTSISSLLAVSSSLCRRLSSMLQVGVSLDDKRGELELTTIELDKLDAPPKVLTHPLVPSTA
uniref:Transmembrane protein n=1 Tax=Ascaris lumbricoides TaxID=6252 RepID=A0A0M3HQ78_ASCLU